ncbi:INO80 complex subunit C [Chanos chanos]|uniref:INO80 complex subunit C n=1 Tax=Chanos chanos TaxID=29144 RepID=A0A6J2W9G2_CHACN|nr:INO80 complex subunit C [Chanos chanos]
MASPSSSGAPITDFTPATVPTNLHTKALPSTTLAAQARGKKRPASPATHSATQSNTSNSKKKKPNVTAAATHAQVTPVEGATEGKPVSSTDTNAQSTEPTLKPLPFKEPTFVHSGIGGAAAGKKNRTWKNLKQILAAERALPWKMNDPNYYSIDAPPSLKPAKKYSDISGLPANYTDPQTKLRFTSSEEFSYIRLLPTDVVTGYLTLRKATCIVP